jgi:nicotinate-nucleotide pyrophosphorylase (carboxylating)
MSTPLNPPPIDAPLLELIRMAIREDLGTSTSFPPGDKTVEIAIPAALQATGTIVSRKPGTLSGTFLLEPLLREYDPHLRFSVEAPDGSRLTPGQPVATISGPARSLLTAERVILNFLCHLSGIATLTRRYVDAVQAVPLPPGHQPPAICDTRKTTPGYRLLDKYAVRCGGGVNHRIGLYDGVMLKDNHLAALRERLGHDLTLAQLTTRIRRELDPAILLWLEVDTLEQLRESLAGDQPGADIILIDNFTPEQTRQAVELRNHAASSRKILLESSGGITLDNIRDYAGTGVDRFSIGSLTHSAPGLDLSMEFA